jgi:DNA polymerase-3 subunit gamma/tau
MSYQVLALKWRPQTFDDVVGQGHVTRTLQNAIRQERVPHAFLFTGSRGIGKTTTARILAKALICKEGPTPEPCGHCNFCSDITTGRSLDVLEIDGASNTGVDNIRELRENAGYAPSSARLKIYIIDEVHMLSTSAFNALLKTLEEPPAHVKFIFATTEVSKVPITIQSRCQRFDFRLLSRDEIRGQLQKIIAAEEVEVSDPALEAIAGAAEGSLRDSQTLLDQVLAYSGEKVEEKDVYEALGIAEEKTVIGFLKALLARDGGECIRTLDLLAGSGYDPRTFTREILTGLRNLALLRISDGMSDLVPASQEGREALAALAGSVTMGRIQSLFDIFMKAEGEIRSTSFPRMLLELAVLKAVRVEELEELRELVGRLEALEGKMPSPPVQERGGSPPPGAPEKAEQNPVDKEPPPPPDDPPADEDGAEEAPMEEEFQAPSAEPDSREDLFGRLVERVRKEGVVLASFLEHGRLTKVEGEGLEITFDAGNGLFVDTLRERENLALLRRAAYEILGRKVEVRLVALELEKGQAAAKKAEETDLKKKYRREALEHPLIQGVLEVFQAQVVDVKVL